MNTERIGSGKQAVERSSVNPHLSMIALAVGQAEEPFFENWIFTVPQCGGKADAAFPVLHHPTQKKKKK